VALSYYAKAARACHPARVFLAMLLVSSSALAAGPDMKLNIDCEIGWQGAYRPLDWTPVDVIVQSGEKTFEARITLTGQQDDISTMTVLHLGVITPETPYRVPLVTKLAFGAPECTLRVQNTADGRAWQKRYQIGDWSGGARMLTAVGAGDLLVGVTGSAAFGLRQLPKGVVVRRASESTSQDRRRAGKLYVKERLAPQLPWDWPGYSALDLLILYDPDWSAMRDQQKAAIREWVSGGGKVLIVLGSHPLPASDPIARLLPLRLGEPRKLELGQRTLQSWGCAGATSRAVNCWALPAAGATGWVVEKHGADEGIFAHGPVGFGRVGVLAFDPAVLGGPQGENLAPFWMEFTKPFLDRGALAAKPAASQEDEGYDYGYDETADSSNAVLTFLLDIPEMEPISILWVVGLLMTLAVVIGPVDYLILRKRDRLPLTWLTFTVYIGLFSVLALFGVKALRAGDTQLRAVSVRDAVEGQEHRWASCYSGIFASDTDDYKLSGLEKSQWWSAIAPFSGRYGYYSGSFSASRQITCAQQDGGSRPVYLPINVWSMQCLLAEACDRAPLPIAARVERKGDRVSATVENRADVPIARVSIRLAGNRVLEFGPVPAKGSRQVEDVLVDRAPWHAQAPQDREAWPFESRPRQQFRPDDAYTAKGTLARSRAIQAYLAQGAAVVCAEYDEAPLAFGLSGRSSKLVHRELVRLVVFPKEGPP
jgi:hypothetical protein